MHYYIDGYNLLFRHYGVSDDFAKDRQGLIEELSKMVQLLELNVTLVFDAQHQHEGSSRSHFQRLEIVFSAHGETADELILHMIKSELHPNKKTVVTSDKKLAWFARRCAAKTESIEHFVDWLNKRHHNKLQQLKRIPELKKTVKPTPKKIKPLPTDHPEACFDFYLELFQKEIEAQVPHESSGEPIRKKGKPLKHRPTEKPLSEVERWRQIFENRLDGGDEESKN